MPAARSLLFCGGTASNQRPTEIQKQLGKSSCDIIGNCWLAADFFTTEVWTSKGLTRYLVLFFIELSTRKIAIAGIALHANGLWMSQVGRNATDAVDGILNGKRFLIHDRDPLFTAEFQSILKTVGVHCVKLPPRSPNLNAHAERFVRSIKESCLNRLILFGEQSVTHAADLKLG